MYLHCWTHTLNSIKYSLDWWFCAKLTNICHFQYCMWFVYSSLKTTCIKYKFCYHLCFILSHLGLKGLHKWIVEYKLYTYRMYCYLCLTFFWTNIMTDVFCNNWLSHFILFTHVIIVYWWQINNINNHFNLNVNFYNFFALVLEVRLNKNCPGMLLAINICAVATPLEWCKPFLSSLFLA